MGVNHQEIFAFTEEIFLVGDTLMQHNTLRGAYFKNI